MPFEKFSMLKENILLDWADFLSHVQNKNISFVDIRKNGSSILYAKSVLLRLKNVLKNKQELLLYLSNSKQKPLNIITSYFYFKKFMED